MAARRHPHLVNVQEITPVETRKGKRFHSFRRQLSRSAGGVQIGCSWMEVPAGKTAYPRHYHCANEEALFILEGSGTLRLGEEIYPVQAGDFVALPAGPADAHQLINSSGQPLRYLVLSTMHPTDITVYPDSKKFGVFGGAAPGGDAGSRFLSGYFRQSVTTDYWEGED